MIDISFNQKSLDSLCNKLTKIATQMITNTETSMNDVMEKAQEKALDNKIGSKDASKIPFEITKEKNEVIGKLKTNMPLSGGTYKFYAPMIEYGTGRLGELEKLGKTKTFVKSGYSYWFLPVEKAPRDFGASRIIVIDGKQFYIMYTQPAHPFMRPTAFYLRDNAKVIISEELKRKVKELCTN